MIRSRAGKIAAAAAMTCATVLLAASAADAKRVSKNFFGINFQAIDEVPESTRSQHLAQIRRLGIREIRINLSWAVIEPLRPNNEGRRYDFSHYDELVAAAAQQRVRIQPTIVQTPRWNTYSDVQLGGRCNGAASISPFALSHYVDLVGAVAHRYGRGGTFWSSHPEIRTPRPFKRYEIWNEPNLAGGWCPAPEPARYADMFVGAADRIHVFDPRAEIMVGGLAEPGPGRVAPYYLRIKDFLRQAVAGHPRFRKEVDSVAVHLFTGPTKRKLLKQLKKFRKYVRKGKVKKKTKMVVNEIGWPTTGSPEALPEGKRAKALKRLATLLPKTNCRLGGVLPHTWASLEVDPANTEHWFGIADPASGRPYKSARKLGKTIRKLTRKRLQGRIDLC